MEDKDILDKYKSTIPKQVWKYITSQILFTVVLIFLGSYVIFSLEGVWQKIACGLLVFIYAVSMYACTYEFAAHDIKSYSRLKAHIWKGFVFGLIPAAVIGLLWAFYAAVWSGGGPKTPVEFGIQVAFVLLTIPYNAFLIPYQGYVMIYGIIMALIIPIIMSGLGYIAGMKNFDVTVYFGRFMYEKNKRKRN